MKQHNRIWRTSVLIGLMASSLVVGTPASAAEDSPVAKAMERTVAAGVPGVYGSTVTPEGPWEGSAGVAAVGTAGKPDPDGRFRAASTTKTFVATVVLQLVAERRIGLDDAVDEHLPGLLPYRERITVRQLLGHTSGLPRDIVHWADLPEIDTKRFESFTPTELVRTATRGAPLAFPPGSDFSYSNIGYTTLGLLVERVTGRSLEREVDDRIVGPLGLADTSMPGDFPFLPGAAARGYEQLYPSPRGRTDVTTYRVSRVWGSGNLISSPADLNTFFRALLGGELLPEPQLRAMQDARPNALGKIGYGLGLMRMSSSCGGPDWFGHAGDMPGYSTWSMHTADLTRSVTAGMNQDLTAPAAAHERMLGGVVPAALCETTAGTRAAVTSVPWLGPGTPPR